MFRSRFPPQPMWDLTIHHFWGPAPSLALVSLSNWCGISQSTPLGLASLLALCSMSGFDTNCNSPRPPLADIALFRLPSELPFKVFKMHPLERGFYTLIKNDLFSSPTHVESHNPLLEVTDLHNDMILSTLRISSHGFALGFPKRPYTNGDSIPHLETHDHSLN